QMMRRLATASVDDPPARRWAMRELRRGDPASLAAAAASLGRFSSHEWIGQVDVPTAVVLTTRDQAVPPHRQQKLADAIAGATVRAALPGPLLARGGDTKVTSAQPFLPVTTTTSVPGPLAGVATPTQPGPSATVAKGVVTPVQSVPRLAGPTTTAARPAPAPAKPCRNTYDAACGPFRWDPDPGPNQPL